MVRNSPTFLVTDQYLLLDLSDLIHLVPDPDSEVFLLVEDVWARFCLLKGDAQSPSLGLFMMWTPSARFTN
jgi:hypothetical protein